MMTTEMSIAEDDYVIPQDIINYPRLEAQLQYRTWK